MTKEQEVFKFLRAESTLAGMSDHELREIAGKLIKIARK